MDLLTDDDFVHNDEPFTQDVPVHEYRMPDSINILPFIRATNTGYNTVISAYSEYFNRRLEEAQRQCVKDTGHGLAMDIPRGPYDEPSSSDTSKIRTYSDVASEILNEMDQEILLQPYIADLQINKISLETYIRNVRETMDKLSAAGCPRAQEGKALYEVSDNTLFKYTLNTLREDLEFMGKFSIVYQRLTTDLVHSNKDADKIISSANYYTFKPSEFPSATVHSNSYLQLQIRNLYRYGVSGSQDLAIYMKQGLELIQRILSSGLSSVKTIEEYKELYPIIAEYSSGIPNFVLGPYIKELDWENVKRKYLLQQAGNIKPLPACCKIDIQEQMYIPSRPEHTGRVFDGDGDPVGNVKIQRIAKAKRPTYNPYSYKTELLDSSFDSNDSAEAPLELEGSQTPVKSVESKTVGKKTASKAKQSESNKSIHAVPKYQQVRSPVKTRGGSNKVVRTHDEWVEQFPSMPKIDASFKKEVLKEVKYKTYVSGLISTGVRGMESPFIRGSSILAR